MQKILILFATREGQTRKVAGAIAQHLKLLGAGVRLVNARDRAAIGQLDLNAFDLLVFGGSMHAGRIERELANYIKRHAAQIACKPRSLFLVLLSAATRDPRRRDASLEEARCKLQQQLQVRFDHIEMVAGALSYSKYSLPVKWLMHWISSKAGEETDISRDYEYTDWRQVERYAQSLVPRDG